MSFTKSQLSSEVDDNSADFENILNDVLPPSGVSTATTRTRESYKTAFLNFMRDFKKLHKNRKYQYVMRLASRKWHAMTQAARAPYVLEAQRNRLADKPQSKLEARKSQQRKKKQGVKQKPSNPRCPSCGHRKKSRERISTSKSHSSKSNTSRSSKSSKSTKSE